MKMIAMSVLAAMSLAQFAHADGAGRALNDKNITCEITLRNGNQVKITRPIAQLDVAQETAGNSVVTLRQSSGNIVITIFKGAGAEVIAGQIGGHGFFQGSAPGASALCSTN